MSQFNILRPHADVAGNVYNIGVKEGDYDDWVFMFDMYQKELIADEKVKSTRLLGLTQHHF